jgi:excisionase family DNA binding protein
VRAVGFGGGARDLDGDVRFVAAQATGNAAMSRPRRGVPASGCRERRHRGYADGTSQGVHCDAVATKKMTAREAARVMKITPGGIYAAIKRGRLPSSKKVKDRWVVTRADLDAWKRQINEWAKEMRKAARKNRRLTDEEFLQRLWDSDPD